MLLFAAFAAALVSANDWDGVLIKGWTDKENPVGYKVGEEIVFTLAATNVPERLAAGEYVLDWRRTGDDGRVETGRAPFKDGEVCRVATRLDIPGFVRLEAYVQDKDGKRVRRDVHTPGAAGWMNGGKDVYFDGGAGVDVGRIGKMTPEPKDFDAWWAEQKRLLATVPLKETLKEVKTRDGCRISELYVDCFGPRPVSGYLFMPVDAKPKSCRAVCVFQGYGFSKQSYPEWRAGHCVRANEIVLEINAHGYELGRDKAYYDEFEKSTHPAGYSYAFSPEENARPETAYFRFMALRVLRALEYLKSLPEWNGKDLLAEGGSQGGLQTSWAAGLDPDVSLARPSITWGCDYAATEPGGRLHGSWFIKYAPGLEYFDAVSHIRRAKCPVEITRAGLGDYVCPPSGLAAYYNAIRTPKSIWWVQGSQHGFVPTSPNQAYAVRDPFGESAVWKDLFDGKDLSGWTEVRDYAVTGGYTSPEPTWAVVDGAIRTTGTPFGYLRTRRGDFGDFVLRLEYRWWRRTEKPNSGVFLRVGAATGAFLPRCYENQLCPPSVCSLYALGGAELEGVAPRNAYDPANPLSGIAAANAKTPSSEKPFGEWNSLEVRVVGDEAICQLNGVEMNRVKGLKIASGAIALQSEGGAAEFRKIQIME